MSYFAVNNTRFLPQNMHNYNQIFSNIRYFYVAQSKAIMILDVHCGHPSIILSSQRKLDFIDRIVISRQFIKIHPRLLKPITFSSIISAAYEEIASCFMFSSVACHIKVRYSGIFTFWYPRPKLSF